MATYNWSTLTNGQTIPFNPAADVLAIDVPTLSASDFGYSNTNPITFTNGNRSVTLQTDLRTLTTQNVTFANGSVFLVGDNTTATVNDDQANTLNGTSGNDTLIGLGGNDVMSGGPGDDSFLMWYATSATGADTIDGGTGTDRLDYSENSVNGATVNLATHTASNSQGTATLTSIEGVNGTSGNDVFVGGDPAHAPDSLGNTTSERFRGERGRAGTSAKGCVRSLGGHRESRGRW